MRKISVLCAGVTFTTFSFLGFAAAEELDIVVKSAPIVPHGLIAGQPLDVTLSFVDLDPQVPGIELRQGGTATIFLPPEVTNLGYPVASVGKAVGCEPPVLGKCSSGGFLHGWPQSPLLPLPNVEYDEAEHALTLTATADAPEYDIDNPGAKLIHLFTFGFQNPQEPGDYPIRLELQPDPDKPVTQTGSALLKVSARREAMLAVDSTQAPNIKGPKFKNTMYQAVKAGDTSYPMSVNMWDADHQPIVGARIEMLSETTGNLIGADGSSLGSVLVDVPDGAKGFLLMSASSFAAKTGLAGYPTGRLVMTLKTARGAPGDYQVTLALNNGDPLVHRITAE